MEGEEMSAKNKPPKKTQPASININMTGNIPGQLAVGENIQQKQHIQAVAGALTKLEQETLFALLETLKQKVASEAPLEQKDTALEKVTQLEETLHTNEPDVSTMGHVKDWFVQNIPQLAGAVTGLIVNPLVGKLVEAAGETVAQDFKRRFGAS
jgi:hypothetical protein